MAATTVKIPATHAALTAGSRATSAPHAWLCRSAQFTMIDNQIAQHYFLPAASERHRHPSAVLIEPNKDRASARVSKSQLCNKYDYFPIPGVIPKTILRSDVAEGTVMGGLLVFLNNSTGRPNYSQDVSDRKERHDH
jgi:hypothetical protein